MFSPSTPTEQSAVTRTSRRVLDFNESGEEHNIERHTSSIDTPASPTCEYTRQADALALAFNTRTPSIHHVSTPVYRQRPVCRHRRRRPCCVEVPIEGFAYNDLANAPLNTFNNRPLLHRNVVTTPTHEATIRRMQ